MAEAPVSEIASENHVSSPEEEIRGRLHTVLPRLPVFSGDPKDTNFDLWEYEVMCLRSEGVREADIRLAIRRSLKGQASRTLLTLGVGASVDDVLQKFKAVFGPTETAQNVLSMFYSLKQGVAEDAGSFAARLEDVILQAVQLGRVDRKDVDTMLREAFEGGLRRETKAVTSYLFASYSQFSELVVAVKRKERELTDKGGTVAAVQASEVDALKTLVLELRTELRTLRNQRDQRPTAPDHHVREDNQTARPQHRPARDQAAWQRRPRTEPVCWRCGMPGHVRSGCRMPLNGTAPVGRGRPQAQ